MPASRPPDDQRTTRRSGRGGRAGRAGSPGAAVGPMAAIARRLRPIIIATIGLLIVASIGYVVIDGYSPFDALYMAAITTGSVGFSEVHPLSNAGRAWTILVIIMGNGLFVYATGSLAGLLMSGEFRRAVRLTREHNLRKRMNKHTIVVGLGRVGDASIDALTRHGVEVVGIDTDTESCDRGRARNVAVMQGDATRDSVLRDAGVDRATALICTIDDMAATSVVLAARALAPTLRIIVRVNDETNGERLLRAGASKVIAPYASVGDDIAMTAINADVVDRHALPVLGMVVEEVIVSTQSPAIDQTAPQLRQRFDLADVTILRLEDNRWSATDHPAADGDVVVLLGTPNDVETAITWVTAHGSQHVAGAP